MYKYLSDGAPATHICRNSEGKEEWRCKFCNQNYLISGGTALPMKHLQKRHDINENSPANARAKNIQANIKLAMDAAAANPQTRRALNNEPSTTIPLDPEVVEVLYVKFITVCSMPLYLVECPEFRAFLTYLNGDVDKYLSTSHNTISTWVVRQYQYEKDKQKQRLRSARSKVHISVDMWTSPNTKAIVVLTACFLSEDNMLEHIVLDLFEVEGTHEGVNLAPYVLKIVEEWGIISKLGWFVMDNAGNNDTMMMAISLGVSISPYCKKLTNDNQQICCISMASYMMLQFIDFAAWATLSILPSMHFCLSRTRRILRNQRTVLCKRTSRKFKRGDGKVRLASCTTLL